MDKLKRTRTPAQNATVTSFACAFCSTANMCHIALRHAEGTCPKSKPSPQFLPYLEKALQRDFGVLLEFYKNAGAPEAAFSEFVGHMVICGDKAAQNTVRRLMRARPWSGKALLDVVRRKRDVRLAAIGKNVRDWLEAWRSRQHAQPFTNREKQWKQYKQEFLASPFSLCPDELKPVFVSGQFQGGHRSVTDQNYIDYGIAPQGFFSLLAQTAPRQLAVSEAVRTYVRQTKQ